MSNTEIDRFYNETFIPAAHRLGIAIPLMALCLTMLPGLYLSFGLGAWPGIDAVLRAFLAIAAFVGVIWVIEPISYFPMLGVSGTYMSFLSGNIGNMRLPVVIACQNAVDAEAATKKAEVVAVIGIAVSVIVNIGFVLAMVLLGTYILSVLPEFAVAMLKNYTLPAIFAAVFVMFINTAKQRLHAVVAIGVGLAILALPLSEVINVTAAGVSGIIASLLVATLTKAPEEKAGKN